MNAWAAVLAAGVASYGLRLGVVVFVARRTLPAWFERVTAYVMPAVMAGLAAIALAGPVSSEVATAAPVVAGAIATVAVARLRSPAMAVVAGMTALWTVSLIVTQFGPA